MINLMTPLKAFLKAETVSIDNTVFRLHYKVTVILLLVFTLLVTTKQYFGDPISCIGDAEKFNNAYNSYCWIYGTFTTRSQLDGAIVSPGIGPDAKGNSDDDKMKHSYYQWVSFVFLGQATMFYIPRYLWKMWEGGRLRALASDLASPLVPKDWSELRRDELISYLSYTQSFSHKLYALRYALCELLNFINVISQILLMDLFLGGAFRNYGAAVVSMGHGPSTDHASPMDRYFPKVTKCTINMYGKTGSINTEVLFCILPLNVVNEKIFTVLWFWFIVLAILSGLAVIFRISVMYMRVRTLLIRTQQHRVNKEIASRVVEQLCYGDWFLLHLLGKNMNPVMYKDLITNLDKNWQKETMMMI